MSKILILVLITECFMTFGQICFKKSANHLSLEENSGKTWVVQILGLIWRYPTLWMGAAAMLVGLLFWFAALSSGALSFVYLLGSIQYIFALIASHFFLNEKINLQKLIGTLLITLGVILTALS